MSDLDSDLESCPHYPLPLLQQVYNHFTYSVSNTTGKFAGFVSNTTGMGVFNTTGLLTELSTAYSVKCV